MAYLTCPFCPSQALPVPKEKLGYWVGGPKEFVPMVKFRCNSKHEFYVEEKKENGYGIHTEHEEASGHCC